MLMLMLGVDGAIEINLCLSSISASVNGRVYVNTYKESVEHIQLCTLKCFYRIYDTVFGLNFKST